MKKINLFWYKHKKGKGNFGDELNPYLIGKLSGSEINYINIDYLNDNLILALKIITSALLHRKISISEFFRLFFWNFIKSPVIILSIGSVLQWSRFKNFTVWGSGIIFSDAKFSNGNFTAVRGPYTQKRLLELGYDSPDVVGDPALLLPLIYTPKKQEQYDIGIIPHYEHYDFILERCPENVLVINLLDEIEDIIDQIASCKITLSTSLHGIIVSHCYNVPSLWTEFPQVSKKLFGDDIKFRDYFSSVNLSEYQPMVIKDILSFDNAEIIRQINSEFGNILIPEIGQIKKMQKKLIDVAPFNVLSKFQI